MFVRICRIRRGFDGLSGIIFAGPFEGEPGVDFGPVPWDGFDIQLAADQRGSLFHAKKAEACAQGRFLPNGGDVESRTIITDTEMDLTVVFLKLDGHVSRFGVAANVGQRFLGDAEALSFDERIETPIKRLQLEFAFQSGGGGLSFGEPLERGAESQIVKHGGPQVQGDVANLFQHPLHCAKALGELRHQRLGRWELQHALKIQLSHSKGLADFVVELERKVAAFTFLSLDEPAGEHLQAAAKFVANLLGGFALGDVPKVALDEFAIVHQVGGADEFDAHHAAVAGLQGKIVKVTVGLAGNLMKIRLRSLDVFERNNFPKFFSKELLARTAQHPNDAGVNVVYFARLGIEDDDSILRRLKQAAVAQFGLAKSFVGMGALLLAVLEILRHEVKAADKAAQFALAGCKAGARGEIPGSQTFARVGEDGQGVHAFFVFHCNPGERNARGASPRVSYDGDVTAILTFSRLRAKRRRLLNLRNLNVPDVAQNPKGSQNPEDHRDNHDDVQNLLNLSVHRDVGINEPQQDSDNDQRDD